MMEGMWAGSVGDVGPPDDEQAFTLYDHENRELIRFNTEGMPGAAAARQGSRP